MEPQLALPGAGLPSYELFIARLLFRYRRYTENHTTFNENFIKERQLIAGLIKNVRIENALKRVLIKRIPGLEDSSRYWSVCMTLDHLRIVHEQISYVIKELLENRVPKGKASTANVKPDAHVTETAFAMYEKSCDMLLNLVSNHKNLKTKKKYAHPWFGPLDAAGWHALAATHLKIHRVQIEHILNNMQ